MTYLLREIFHNTLQNRDRPSPQDQSLSLDIDSPLTSFPRGGPSILSLSVGLDSLFRIATKGKRNAE